MVALHGPTFLDLLLIVNVHLDKGTVLFASGSLGNLAGSLIGGIVYDRFNKELTLMISTLMMGALTVLLPFTRYLPVMAVINCLRSSFMGGLDAGEWKIVFLFSYLIAALYIMLALPALHYS